MSWQWVIVLIALCTLVGFLSAFDMWTKRRYEDHKKLDQ